MAAEEAEPVWAARILREIDGHVQAYVAALNAAYQETLARELRRDWVSAVLRAIPKKDTDWLEIPRTYDGVLLSLPMPRYMMSAYLSIEVNTHAQLAALLARFRRESRRIVRSPGLMNLSRRGLLHYPRIYERYPDVFLERPGTDPAFSKTLFAAASIFRLGKGVLVLRAHAAYLAAQEAHLPDTPVLEVQLYSQRRNVERLQFDVVIQPLYVGNPLDMKWLTTFLKKTDALGILTIHSHIMPLDRLTLANAFPLRSRSPAKN